MWPDAWLLNGQVDGTGRRAFLIARVMGGSAQGRVGDNALVDTPGPLARSPSVGTYPSNSDRIYLNERNCVICKSEPTTRRPSLGLETTRRREHARMRLHDSIQSPAALRARTLKGFEYCLGGRENRNHSGISIEHSKREGAVDDAQDRRCRRFFVDCEGLDQVG